jgi:hypothetical protein
MPHHYLSAKFAVNALLLTTVSLQVILLPSHASKPPAKSSISYRHPSENRRAKRSRRTDRGTAMGGMQRGKDSVSDEVTSCDGYSGWANIDCYSSNRGTRVNAAQSEHHSDVTIDCDLLNSNTLCLKD